jgi:two-component system chemotaxis response regulator CheY
MAETPPPRILIIDDASLVRLYYRDAIGQAGYIVEEALNGVEALEKLLLHPADLLIVDINMPKMDGLTFLRTLRRLPSQAAAIPALVTSTEAAPQDRLAARQAGANFYLVKPIAPEMLRSFIAMFCGEPA